MSELSYNFKTGEMKDLKEVKTYKPPKKQSKKHPKLFDDKKDDIKS